MTKYERPSVAHLDWLVQSRTRNQAAAIRIYRLFEDFPDKMRNSKNRAIAEALVAITFSLWRAAFLADKSGAKGKSSDHAEEFLGKMLLNNAINYSEDRAAREWTFNYYVANAHSRFSILSKNGNWPDFLVDKGQAQTPKQRWEYYQGKLEAALDLFEKRFQLRRISDLDRPWSY